PARSRRPTGCCRRARWTGRADRGRQSWLRPRAASRRASPRPSARTGPSRSRSPLLARSSSAANGADKIILASARDSSSGESARASTPTRWAPTLSSIAPRATVRLPSERISTTMRATTGSCSAGSSSTSSGSAGRTLGPSEARVSERAEAEPSTIRVRPDDEVGLTGDVTAAAQQLPSRLPRRQACCVSAPRNRGWTRTAGFAYADRVTWKRRASALALLLGACSSADEAAADPYPSADSGLSSLGEADEDEDEDADAGEGDGDGDGEQDTGPTLDLGGDTKLVCDPW